MKNSAKYLSLVFAAGSVGVALFKLANSSFTSSINGDLAVAVVTSVSLIGLAIYDYSRRSRSLVVPARVLRPALPAKSLASPQTVAFRAKSPRTQHLAA